MLNPASSFLHPSIFRAYDIRGIADETLTEQGIFLIGKAVGSMVREQGGHQLTIARDGRLSGPKLSKALANGILASGCDVIDLGMAPTPLLYYATFILHNRSGIMLTGSHNPAEYNGLKIVINNQSLSESALQELRVRIIEERFYHGQGHYHEMDMVDRYIRHLSRHIHLTRPLHIVVDAGNGVAGMMAADLFKSLGCTVHELFCDVDGRFPNHHPDPSQPENLQDLIRSVREVKADIGLAFDGDGDRLGVVTSEGEIIWPDRLLMLFARALLATTPYSKIIYDVKCTHHLPTLIRSLNGEPMMWKTGHTFIKAKMIEVQAQLAGEMSGHFFFKDRWYGFDDAFYAACRLLEIISAQPLSSSALFETIPNSVNTAELKVSVLEEEKFQLMQQLIDSVDRIPLNEMMAIDGLRINFEEGWGLVRPSNTTPYLILRFEAINQAVLENIQSIFRTWMLSVKPDLVLPF